MRVRTVAPGSPSHGVVRHAAAVAGLLGCPDGPPDLVHAHFTDALWGPDIARAAAAFVAWAAALTAPLVVTLHDVPGIDPDPARDARRTAGYRAVAEAARAVVVASDREARDVARWSGVRAAVVPLPVEPLASPGPPPAWAARPTVGVLGFLYPGKGHAEAVDAAAGTGALVVALGAPSPGHLGLVEELATRARRRGVDLLVTGHLSDADLHAAARAVTVPVAASSTLGASGSLATWLAAGRRPLATPTAHARDVLARWPGSLQLVPPGALEPAVAAALAAPGRTWLAGPPPRPDVAAAHRAVFAAVLDRVPA